MSILIKKLLSEKSKFNCIFKYKYGKLVFKYFFKVFYTFGKNCIMIVYIM